MSLLDALRAGIKVADQVTKPLQATVSLEHFQSVDGYGNETYGPVYMLPAICDYNRRQVRTREGVLSVCRITVTFLDVDALKVATNGDGIDEKDRIILPDGSTGPILDFSGFIDAQTGLPVAPEVMIG